MVSFAERYGFCFRCHELGHCNRKAGEERSFWTVETNFLPGRSFESLEDLNRQAYEWATVRMHHRPVRKTGLIPAQAFEHERRYLVPLSPHLPAPYCPYERGTDEYGYVSFQGNYYWIPGSQREDVKVLEYADHLELYQHRVCVAQYSLPADGVKNARFSPEGQPAPRHQPRRHRQGSELEEKRLRALGPEVAACHSLHDPWRVQELELIRANGLDLGHFGSESTTFVVTDRKFNLDVVGSAHVELVWCLITRTFSDRRWTCLVQFLHPTATDREHLPTDPS